MATARLEIKRSALLSALEGAKSVFPREFIALFRGEERGDKILLTELIIAPLSDYGEGFSAFSNLHLPPHLGTLASFHSHPAPPPRPSRADLHFFARSARFHFIACPPFEWKSVRAFDSQGREVAFRII